MARGFAFNPFTGTFDIVDDDASSASIILQKVAAVNLSGDRVVTPRPDGTVEYADAATLNHCVQPLWLTLGAVLAGSAVNVLALGEAIEVSWSWIAGEPVFLGLNGALTQVPPVLPGAAFIQQVAATTASPTSIFFDPQIAIIL